MRLATGVILALALSTAAVPALAAPLSAADRAARVTITRDDWGIAHVRGHSDADAVFGAIYAQAEDDFPRVEANLLTALGRSAEAEGEGALPADLQPGFMFAGAITTAARQPDAAMALLRFLASPQAAATLERHGLASPGR